MRDEDLVKARNDAEQLEVINDELPTATSSFVTSLGCGKFRKPTEMTTAEVDRPARISRGGPSTVVESTPCSITFPCSTAPTTSDRTLISENPTPSATTANTSCRKSAMAVTAERATVLSGTVTVPSGTVTVPSGTVTVPSGTVTVPSGTVTVPSGTVTVPLGTTTVTYTEWTNEWSTTEWPTETYTEWYTVEPDDFTSDINAPVPKSATTTMTGTIATRCTGSYTSCHPSTMTTPPVHTPITMLANCDSNCGFDTAVSYHTEPSSVHNTAESSTRSVSDDVAGNSVDNDVRILITSAHLFNDGSFTRGILVAIGCIAIATMGLVMFRRSSLRNSLKRAFCLGIITGVLALWILDCEEIYVMIRLGLAGIDPMKASMADKSTAASKKPETEAAAGKSEGTTADTITAVVDGIIRLFETRFSKNPAVAVACIGCFMIIILVYREPDLPYSALEIVAGAVAMLIVMVKLPADPTWAFFLCSVLGFIGIAGLDFLIRIAFMWLPANKAEDTKENGNATKEKAEAATEKAEATKEKAKANVCLRQRFSFKWLRAANETEATQ